MKNIKLNENIFNCSIKIAILKNILHIRPELEVFGKALSFS